MCPKTLANSCVSCAFLKLELTLSSTLGLSYECLRSAVVTLVD